MFFFWADEINKEINHVTPYLAQFNHSFILTPLIRLNDKANHTEALTQLSNTSENITVEPIYLKSQNSSFTNLLNPNTLIHDLRSIRKTLKHSKPDVIVCFYLSHAYPLVLLKRSLKFSLCTVAMGSDVNLDNSFLQKMARKFVYRNSALIFARSWKLKEKIEEEHPCNVVVSPSSASTSFFRPISGKSQLRSNWGLELACPVILTVCRLDKNKGVDVLLNAISLSKHQNIHLLIVGEGTEKNALEELSRKLGLEKRVVFLGQRSKQELLELYNLADVFVLASYSEGLPRVLIEAMACSCIPVATNVGSVSALVADGVNGFLTEPGCEAGLSKAVEKVLTLPVEESALMRARARQMVVEGFDSKKVWESLINTITLGGQESCS
jgi:glycosyltransferase involved in cell wall biosynthesis